LIGFGLVLFGDERGGGRPGKGTHHVIVQHELRHHVHKLLYTHTHTHTHAHTHTRTHAHIQNKY